MYIHIDFGHPCIITQHDCAYGLTDIALTDHVPFYTVACMYTRVSQTPLVLLHDVRLHG